MMVGTLDGWYDLRADCRIVTTNTAANAGAPALYYMRVVHAQRMLRQGACCSDGELQNATRRPQGAGTRYKRQCVSWYIAMHLLKPSERGEGGGHRSSVLGARCSVLGARSSVTWCPQVRGLFWCAVCGWAGLVGRCVRRGLHACWAGQGARGRWRAMPFVKPRNFSLQKAHGVRIQAKATCKRACSAILSMSSHLMDDG